MIKLVVLLPVIQTWCEPQHCSPRLHTLLVLQLTGELATRVHLGVWLWKDPWWKGMWVSFLETFKILQFLAGLSNLPTLPLISEETILQRNAGYAWQPFCIREQVKKQVLKASISESLHGLDDMLHDSSKHTEIFKHSKTYFTEVADQKTLMYYSNWKSASHPKKLEKCRLCSGALSATNHKL